MSSPTDCNSPAFASGASFTNRSGASTFNKINTTSNPPCSSSTTILDYNPRASQQGSQDSHGLRPAPTGIRKRTARRRTLSTCYGQPLRHTDLLSPTTSDYCKDLGVSTQSLWQWYLPQHSLSSTTSLLPYADIHPALDPWSLPTPPLSETDLPSTAPDVTDDQDPILCGAGSDNFVFADVINAVEMSSLGYLLPGQYANGVSQPDSNGYIIDHNRSQSSIAAQFSYHHTASSLSSSPFQSRSAPQYTSDRQSSISGSIYDTGRRMTEQHNSPATSDYSFSSAQSVTPLSSLSSVLPPSTVPSPSIPALLPSYGDMTRPHGVYDSTHYHPPTTYTSTPVSAPTYTPQHMVHAHTPYAGNNELSRESSADLSATSPGPRPKAQCWEHGCNGRQFSTFSNLLRHQREKSGTAAKSYCPRCGAEFTRTTARNGHLQHDKCIKTR